LTANHKEEPSFNSMSCRPSTRLGDG